MKTIHEYEAADIDLKDPIHGFLMGQLLVVMLTGLKNQPDDPTDDPTFALKRNIANFLNAAQKAGITVARAVPEVFTA